MKIEEVKRLHEIAKEIESLEKVVAFCNGYGEEYAFSMEFIDTSLRGRKLVGIRGRINIDPKYSRDVSIMFRQKLKDIKEELSKAQLVTT